jgi:hypothetical protein
LPLNVTTCGSPVDEHVMVPAQVVMPAHVAHVHSGVGGGVGAGGTGVAGALSSVPFGVSPPVPTGVPPPAKWRASPPVIAVLAMPKVVGVRPVSN